MLKKVLTRACAVILPVVLVLASLTGVLTLKTIHTGALQEGLYLSDDS